ncbi:MAG: hypothetical protein V4708_16565, partial [Bacteroidota bacterium]
MLFRKATFPVNKGAPLKLSSKRSRLALEAGKKVLFSELAIMVSSKPFVKYASYAYTQFLRYFFPTGYEVSNKGIVNHVFT